MLARRRVSTEPSRAGDERRMFSSNNDKGGGRGGGGGSNYKPITNGGYRDDDSDSSDDDDLGNAAKDDFVSREIRQQKLMLKQQDVGLELLSESADRLAQISMGIHEELGHQNK